VTIDPDSMFEPADFESLLAPYAMRSIHSLGRRYPEEEHPYRPIYVRDRDRIIHSGAFRRLAYKTQVFVDQPNDHHRTRLTHTLEVVQMARTIARRLRLNEDLTEAIAMVHDLGHPPFGHAGERVLDQLTQSVGGFEHNAQGLRLVEKLESRYPHFPGLNLSWEVLESISLHSKQSMGNPSDDFPSMLAESQVVDLADSIAYSTHDIDDAIRHQIITFDDLHVVEIWRWADQRSLQVYGEDLVGKQRTRGVIRCLIDGQVGGLIEESRARLAGLKSTDDVRTQKSPVIALPSELARMKSELREFLFTRVYRSEVVTKRTREGEELVRRLFERIVQQPDLLPEKYRRTDEPFERGVADYIASMTDRYAEKTWRQMGG
jgi:dGTPase